MPMKTPPHPGHSIKHACLDPLRLNVTDGAKALGVARHTLSFDLARARQRESEIRVKRYEHDALSAR